MLKALIAAITFIAFTHLGFSQEMLGIVNSNFAGTAGIMINSSSIANSPFVFEFNLITADLFLENNYLYIPNNSLMSLKSRFENEEDLLAYTNKNINEDGKMSDFVLKDGYTNSSVRKNVYFNTHAMGPSFMIRIKDHSFALHTAVRTNISIVGVHHSIAKYAFEGLPYRNQHFEKFSAPKFRINILSWSEYGLTYATVFTRNQDYLIKGGATIKYINGHLGAYFNNGILEYEITEQDPILFERLDASIYNVDLDYGYTDPSTLDNGSINKGQGYGISIGGAYEQMVDDPDKYKWRIGASLMDIGSINIKSDASSFNLNNSQRTWIRVDTAKFKNISQADSVISVKIYNDMTSSKGGNSFRMGLPSAISVQGDYRVRDYIFINMTWVQRIPKRGPGIDRGNLISVTPRFEMKWLELALPLLLYEYTRPRFGLAARLGYLTVGSDNFSSLFFKHKFTGFDIYASLRIFFTEGKGRKGKAKGMPKGKGTPCYKFN